MSVRVPPHDLQAERSLVGAMLLSVHAIEAASMALTPADFYDPGHAHIFDVIVRLCEGGHPVDPVTVAAALTQVGLLGVVGGLGRLVELQAATPATTNAARYASIIEGKARRRRLLGAAGEIVEAVYGDMDDGEVTDFARDAVENVEAQSTVLLPETFSTTAVFLKEVLDAGDDFAPWLIPGIMKRSFRVLLVGRPGSGKSTLTAQIAMAASAGRHPFTGAPLDARLRTLNLDAENSDEKIADTLRPMYDDAVADGGWGDDDSYLWRCQRGMNLADRADRVRFENVIRAARPDLVCIGPAYRLAHLDGPGEAVASTNAMRVLDMLRIRYQFGLLLEIHPAKADGEISPKGNSGWSQWPEIGLSMVKDPDDENLCVLSRFRADRVDNEWPEAVRRSGGAWPWEPCAAPNPTRPPAVF